MTIKNVQSAGGIIFKDGLVLLVKSKSTNRVSIPKGKAEPSELIEETALREVREETGYITKIVSKIGSINFDFEKDGELRNKTVTFFRLELLDDSDPKPNLQEGEDFENIWVTPNEAISLLTFNEDRELLEKGCLEPLDTTRA